MKNIFRFLLISLCWLLIANISQAEIFHKGGAKKSDPIKSTAAGCEPGSVSKYLDINNVRTLIYSYGNMWFLENAEYEIPKGSGKMSMFSASLWIGGIDINNNLKLAAYRYGQGPTGGSAHTKNDFWPGPLTTDGTAAVESETCAKYDKLYAITRAEVQEFLAWWDDPAAYPSYTPPKSITEWPGNGETSNGQAKYLAPFFDLDGNGRYEPENGDYPYYDLANTLCQSNLKPGERLTRAHLRNGEPDDTLGILVDQVLKGDQTLWSVFNDKGNIHTETQGQPIGLEIRAQAFAFATNDEINNMTFYSYEIINRSTYTLTGTYFSQWVDPDLGWAQDDYVGCDVRRGLGYCYNGRPVDGSGQVEAYGAHPPAIGVDFFQGPYMDPDHRDNPKFTGDCSILTSADTLDQMAINGADAGYGDGILDNERFGMRRFVYHNNSLSGVPQFMQDPDYAPEYYNFLRGIWKDNTKMMYGGNAHASAGGYGPATDFMFPDESDICFWGTKGQPPNGPVKWTEETAGNNPSDRRFMQSAGPFTLLPGACNYITVGIPWARSISGTPFESVELLRIVDDKCQSLFDNCFAVLSGPNAPDLTIEELDKKVILYLTNRKFNDAGNNYKEKYSEYDPNIPNPDTLAHNERNDSLYHFEGYQIFQLKDATVSAADIDDPTKARLVAQCDIQNGVSKLVNWTYDQNIGGNVGAIMVQGGDEGIDHSFVITEDKFATDNKALINHKQYYYVAIAYAYNMFKEYDPNEISKMDGQKKPYLRGRTNIKVYTAIPHITIGDKVNGDYGTGPAITRIQGQGNGGMIVEFSDKTIAEILSKKPADSAVNIFGSSDYPIAYHPEYKEGYGPVNVKVVDPLSVAPGNYILKFDSMVSGPANSPFVNQKIKFGKWNLFETRSGKTYTADTTTIYPYEQLFLDLGLALTINQVPYPGDTKDTVAGNVYENNGLLWAPPAIWADSTKVWLTGVEDSDVPADWNNWIRAGTYKGDEARFYDFDMGNDNPWDPNQNFEKIQNGTWSPYCLTAVGGNDENIMGPAYSKTSKLLSPMENLASVNIVITPNKDQWTRCLVVELCPNQNLSEGKVKQFSPRAHRSVNIDGDTGVISGDPKYNSDYINAYGMGWFPGYAINLETGERLNMMFGENSWDVADNGRDMLWNPTSRLTTAGLQPVFGGMHYVYVMGHLDMQAATGMLNYPAYDAGAYIRKTINKTPAAIYMPYTYGSSMYVFMPIAVDGVPWLDNQVTYKIRVAKPYQRYFSTSLPQSYSDTAENNCNPMYGFSTDAIATSFSNTEVGKSQLDLINVVPNPYYAYDDYERDQLDNRIKIVNLPENCTITIFDVSGTMIRQFVVDKSGIKEPRSSTDGINTDAKTSIDWDLKNFAGIPIAGGVYLIHVKADGLGERTLKWFGVLRPTDLNSY